MPSAVFADEEETPSGVDYTPFPEHPPDSPSVFGDGGQYPGYVVSLAVIGGALALPPVTRATGVSSTQTLALIGLHFVVCSVNMWVVGPMARRNRAAFKFGIVVDLLVGLVVACGLPALGGTPNTMLWNLTILYACLNGAMDIRPSWFYLVAHTVFPLLTIPMFDWRADAWGLAGPVLAASASAGQLPLHGEDDRGVARHSAAAGAATSAPRAGEHPSRARTARARSA